MRRTSIALVLTATVFTVTCSHSTRRGGRVSSTASAGCVDDHPLVDPAPQGPDANTTDAFGNAVAAVGKDMLVGVPRYSPSGEPFQGIAYLFSGTSGALIGTYPN